jgi:2-keto-3-deoxy-L-rhamnonate aldolase RhmA
MKIIIEIGPSKTTEFLGSQVQRVKTGSQKAKKTVKSSFLRVRAAGKALVTKPASPDQAKVVS